MKKNPGKHPNKEIRAAVEYAKLNGWIFEKSDKSSHAWAIMKCPYNDQHCLSIFYSSNLSSSQCIYLKPVNVYGFRK